VVTVHVDRSLCIVRIMWCPSTSYIPGRSEGVPTEKGINLDAEAVLKFAKGHPR
jgi:hypothetical protein